MAADRKAREPIFVPDYAPPKCPQCGVSGFPVGRVSLLDWWTCKQCGMDFSTFTEEQEEDG